jgi:hypothetical protein
MIMSGNFPAFLRLVDMAPTTRTRVLGVVTAVIAAMCGGLACRSSSAPRPPGDDGQVGSIRMALTATANGHSYRLRQATFTISGPTSTVLDGEAQPDEAALTAVLDVGSYTILLGGSWFLERLDANGPFQVNATLTSPNPQTFAITNGMTTGVSFSFTTDGTMVTIGTGTVSVTTQVTETPAGSLSLIAGQLGGLGSGDGVGADGRFFEPTGAVGDGAGNLYVADTFNNTVRHIDIATLAVTTLAGTATTAGSDDGLGAAARFNSPVGPALDGAGNVYVADRFNLTIRKIVIATGEVTTLAGTAGSQGSADGVGPGALFSDPRAVAGDGAGNLYVADGNTIRKIVIATRMVTTLAGLDNDPFGGQDGVGSDARFSNPQGVTADGAGNLYVADTNNQTIRKIVIATATVTTIAGTPGLGGNTDGVGQLAQFNEPSAITSDGAGNLFVADGENDEVRKIVIATGQVTTLAGSGNFGAADGVGAAAAFGFPEGIASDGAGNVWVTDTSNDAIRKVVLATGEVTTPVGALFPLAPPSDGVGGDVTLSGVSSMASDGAGNIYLGQGSTIRKVVVATGEVTTVAGAADASGVVDGVGSDVRFAGPRGLTFDNGVLYMADDNTVRQFVIATGAATTIAGTSGVSGAADGVGAAATFDTPISVASDGAGNLFVSDFFNGLIRRVELATGTVTTIAGTLNAFTIVDGVGPAASFFSPQAIVHDSGHLLYVMDGTTLRRVDLTTAAVVTIAGAASDGGAVDGIGTAARFSLADGLARDGAGDLFVADTQGHTIRKVVISTLAVTTVVGNPTQFGVHLGPLPARLTLPESVVVLPDGALAISDEAAVLLAAFQ